MWCQYTLVVVVNWVEGNVDSSLIVTVKMKWYIHSELFEPVGIPFSLSSCSWKSNVLYFGSRIGVISLFLWQLRNHTVSKLENIANVGVSGITTISKGSISETIQNNWTRMRILKNIITCTSYIMKNSFSCDIV